MSDTLYCWQRRFPAPIADPPVARADPRAAARTAPAPGDLRGPSDLRFVLRDGPTLRLPTGTALALVVSLVHAMEAR